MAMLPVEVARNKAARLNPSSQAKAVLTLEEVQKRRKTHGLVGLVNIGNSCFMNASVQALSNCPAFRQYLMDCCPSKSNEHRVSVALGDLFRAMWGTYQRSVPRLSCRSVGECIKSRLFRGNQQQDAQEFLRCLLNQIHEETCFKIPDTASSQSDSRSTTGSLSSYGSGDAPVGVTIQEDGDLSDSSNGSQVRLVAKECKDVNRENQQTVETLASGQVYYVDIKTLVIQNYEEKAPVVEEVGVKPSELQKHEVKVKENPVDKGVEPVLKGSVSHGTSRNSSSSSSNSPVTLLRSLQESGHSSSRLSLVLPSLKVSDKGAKKGPSPGLHPKLPPHPQTRSIVSDVFEGRMESAVKCLKCDQLSLTVDSFQDLSLPIPGRSEMAKANKIEERDPEPSSSARKSLCNLFSKARDWTRDLILGPPTSLDDCLNVFFDKCDLLNENKYFCQTCNSLQNGQKVTRIVKLPEVLCIHLKRFRFDSFHPSKIGRQISFPLDDLDMEKYMKEQSSGSTEVTYELISVVTHMGEPNFGHYVAYAKNGDLTTWYKYDDNEVYEVSTDEVAAKQAYLLFYKKKLTLSQQDEKATLLRDISFNESDQKASDGQNDTTFCCISKHWMTLLRNASNPGPLFQYDYICKHGAILPTVNRKDFPHIIEHIPMAAWQKLSERFGSCPLVLDLHVCGQCQEYYGHLESKRKQEREEIQRLQSCREPETHFITEDWVSNWRKFLKSRTIYDGPPGPIDNKTLLTIHDGKMYLTRDSNQYHRISETCWNFLHQNYGGDPVITSRPYPIPKS